MPVLLVDNAYGAGVVLKLWTSAQNKQGVRLLPYTLWQSGEHMLDLRPSPKIANKLTNKPTVSPRKKRGLFSGNNIKGGTMPRGFNFDQFDLDIAKALGEVPEDTVVENYTAYHPATESAEPAPSPDYMKRLYGVKSIGSIVVPKLQ